jgi:clan AA aspartic protease
VVGAVQPNLDATLRLRIRAADGSEVTLSVVVDTGFNDWLALPGKLVQQLGLTFREEALYTLADGSEAATRLFTGEVRWFDSWRRILVVEMEGGPLMGMALLRGSRLQIDVVAGGRVEVHPL